MFKELAKNGSEMGWFCRQPTANSYKEPFKGTRAFDVPCG